MVEFSSLPKDGEPGAAYSSARRQFDLFGREYLKMRNTILKEVQQKILPPFTVGAFKARSLKRVAFKFLKATLFYLTEKLLPALLRFGEFSSGSFKSKRFFRVVEK